MSLVHKDDYYETPDWLIERIEKITNCDFTLDLCANMNNSKCDQYISEDEDFLTKDLDSFGFGLCNPPRSKNGKFVTKCMDIYDISDDGIVMLLCWNDLGNKYAEKLRNLMFEGRFFYENLGKIKFDKNGIESKHVSRLNYFWVWLK